MTKPMITIHNVSTGEIVEREMTQAEATQKAKDEAEASLHEQRQTEFRAAKEAAQAKLAALGLTSEDLKALGL
jgi:hypothetical protein